MLTHQTVSQFPGFWSCPQTNNAPSVDLTRYVNGSWYYIYSINNIDEAGDTCSREDLTIVSSQIVRKVSTVIRNNKKRTIKANDVLNDSGNGGVLTIYNIDGTPCKYFSLFAWTDFFDFLLYFFQTVSYSFSYVILYTDYDNLSIAWSCTPYLFFNSQLSWILSRKPTLSSDSLTKVKAVLQSYGIPFDSRYTAQNQTNCPQFWS